MNLLLAGRPYDVVICPRPIIRDGEPCAAWFDPGNARILISDQVPRADRERRLRHEAWHAWQHHAGLTDDPDPEALADAVAAFSSEFDRQFAQIGGAAALASLEPAEVPGTQRGARMLVDRVECPHCHTSVMCGSVSNGPPEYDAGSGFWKIARGFWCDACDRVFAWHEQSLADGTPIGLLVPHPPPRQLTGPEAAEWFRHNAAAARVCV